MNIKNGIAVNFAYDASEMKKYKSAGKALDDYKFRLELEAQYGSKRRKGEQRKEKFVKLLVMFFFMSYEMILILKGVGNLLVEEQVYVGLGNKIADVFNKIAFIYTIILIISVIYCKKRKRSMWCNYFEILGEVIKCFFKAMIGWVIVFGAIYVVNFFFPIESSLLYKMLDEKIQIYENIQIEQQVEGEEYVGYEDLLEEELDFIDNMNTLKNRE